MNSINKKRGLSPNERLFVTGQLQNFERAVLNVQEEEAVQLLIGVGFSDKKARRIANDILVNPRKYGYCHGGCL